MVGLALGRVKGGPKAGGGKVEGFARCECVCGGSCAAGEFPKGDRAYEAGGKGSGDLLLLLLLFSRGEMEAPGEVSEWGRSEEGGWAGSEPRGDWRGGRCSRRGESAGWKKGRGGTVGEDTPR